MSATSPDAASTQPWLGPLLAWIAGGVDAIGYLLLGQVFTAHMSGNSAALGAHLGHGEWLAALHRAVPIPFFVLGVALGALWIEGAARRGVRSPCAGALWGETLLLLLFLVVCLRTDPQAGSEGPTWQVEALTVLPTVAMGLQSAVLRRAGCTKVRTTYVSGMLTNFAEEGVRLLWCVRDRGAVEERQATGQRMGLYGGIWAAFFCGATLGAMAELYLSQYALVLPLVGLSFVLWCDQEQPIPLRDSLLASAPEHAGQRMNGGAMPDDRAV